MSATTRLVQVQTTTPTKEDAERLAAALVERRLAACVQIVGPVESRFRWQGGVETVDEWLCLVKTTAAAYPGVESLITTMHAYDVPEVIAVPVEAASDAYAGWVAEETAQA